MGSCSPETSPVLDCIKRNLREVILPLSSVFVRPPHGVLHPALGPPPYEGYGPVVEYPEEATEMIRRLEHFCYEDRLRELVVFSLEKSRLWGDL